MKAGGPFLGKRVISDKERETNYQRHITNLHKVYDKDNNVQDIVNSIQSKIDFQHKNRFNTQKYKQEQQKSQIQKENKKLLSALIDISENDKIAQQVQESANLILVQPSSKLYQKQMINYKIQNENFQLAYRMVNLPSVYTKKIQDAEYKLHKKRVQLLQKFQPEQNFDPFQSHFSSKSTHRSSSPMSKSYMFMNNMSSSNKKTGQTHHSFYMPSSSGSSKKYVGNIQSNSLNNQSLRLNESTSLEKNNNHSSLKNPPPPMFSYNDRYYGEPIKEQLDGQQNNSLFSNRSQSQSRQIEKYAQNFLQNDNSNTNYNLYQSPNYNNDLTNPPQTAVSVIPEYCITPQKQLKQEIKVVMKIFNFSLKIKPRTDDLNDHFYFILKMSGNSKKQTPFFKYEMISQIEFPFTFKIKNNNRSPFSRKNSQTQQQDGLNSPNSRNQIHQIKCQLIQNKGNLQHLIGHFYLDIDSSKQGINEIDAAIFHKDGDDQIIGQTKVILHVDAARISIRRKTLKQHELSDTYSVPLDQSTPSYNNNMHQIRNHTQSHYNSGNTSLQTSLQGNLNSLLSPQSHSNVNGHTNSTVKNNQQTNSNSKNFYDQGNHNSQEKNSYPQQQDQNYQSHYQEFGYQPKPDNYRQYKSSSVDKRPNKQRLAEDRLRSSSRKIQNDILNQQSQQNNDKNNNNIQSNEDTDQENQQNLDTIQEYSQNKASIGSNQQSNLSNSNSKTFRNTFLDGQIGQINKDIFLIKQNLKQTNSSQNQKESLIKIHALKNRLKQIKVELGTIEQAHMPFSPSSIPNSSTKKNKSSSNKKKVPQLHLNLLQKETI